MIEKEFLLASSLKAFLIHDANATCELVDGKPLIEFVKEGELEEIEIYISLMKWEIHHGLKINPEDYINMSIEEIVKNALEEPQLALDSYMDHFLHRIREISEAYEIYNSAAEEYAKESDKEDYLNNKN